MLFKSFYLNPFFMINAGYYILVLLLFVLYQLSTYAACQIFS